MIMTCYFPLLLHALLFLAQEELKHADARSPLILLIVWFTKKYGYLSDSEVKTCPDYEIEGILQFVKQLDTKSGNRGKLAISLLFAFILLFNRLVARIFGLSVPHMWTRYSNENRHKMSFTGSVNQALRSREWDG